MSGHSEGYGSLIGGVRYEPRLVEEAVLRAVRAGSAGDERAFREQRDAAYEIDDPDAREVEFGRVHETWFARMQLGAPVERALSDTPALQRRTYECRVASATSRKEEIAELFDLQARRAGAVAPVAPPARRDRSKVILVRLRPKSFQAPAALLFFLRREFLHVDDMVSPRFDYRKQLPGSDAGPSYDNILRNRYRVVWDTTIDGRLQGQGVLPSGVRDARLREFTATFPMLGAAARESFSRWFGAAHPTHAQILAFIQAPSGRGADGEDRRGRCPICRFPTATLDARPERLSTEARREIEADYPGWRLEQGLCSQCADLYMARSREQR